MTNSPVGAAAGCDLLILFFKIKIKRSQPAAAPTPGISQAIKSPTTSSGGLARQAGNSLWADLALGIRQKRSYF